MCGIVGLLLKRDDLHGRLGELVTPMIDCMGTRGPDSAGLAVFHELQVPVAEFSMPQFLQAGLDPLWLRVLSHRHPRELEFPREDRSRQEKLPRFYKNELVNLSLRNTLNQISCHKESYLLFTDPANGLVKWYF